MSKLNLKVFLSFLIILTPWSYFFIFYRKS